MSKTKATTWAEAFMAEAERLAEENGITLTSATCVLLVTFVGEMHGSGKLPYFPPQVVKAVIGGSGD